MPLAALGVVVTALAATVVWPVQSAAALTSVLRPDGDVVRQWTGTPGTAWTALDDPVTQPTSVPATDYIHAGTSGRVTEVTLATNRACWPGLSARHGEPISRR